MKRNKNMYSLREIEHRDINVINKWHNDYTLSLNLGGGFHYVNEEVDMEWFEKYLQTRDSSIRCVILNEETKHVIGCTYLLNINWVNRNAEFHIMIGDTDARKKGAGTFAMKKMIHHAFYDLNLHRLTLEVLEKNTAAIHLYTKEGFIREGMKREVVYKNGQYLNCVIMGLLREEYTEQTE